MMPQIPNQKTFRKKGKIFKINSKFWPIFSKNSRDIRKKSPHQLLVYKLSTNIISVYTLFRKKGLPLRSLKISRREKVPHRMHLPESGLK